MSSAASVASASAVVEVGVGVGAMMGVVVNLGGAGLDEIRAFTPR